MPLGAHPLALSLLAHLVIVHLVGSIRIFDVQDLSTSISRWFHVVDIPEPLPAPSPMIGGGPEETAMIELDWLVDEDEERERPDWRCRDGGPGRDGDDADH